MKKFILSVICAACLCGMCQAQTIPTHDRVDLSFAATTRYNLNFKWNSVHQAHQFNQPERYGYRGDYTARINRNMRVSMFGETNSLAAETSNLFDRDYVRTQNLGFNYGYNSGNWLVNMSWSRKSTNQTTGKPVVPDNNLKIEINTRLF